jgi:hypothetical protein
MSNKGSNKSIKKGERSNQLTQATGYDVKRMVFGEPVNGTIPDSPITYRRIPISTVNKDGSIGDLIIPTCRLFSFGVQENLDFTTKKPNGHVLPLCLWSRNGATAEEKAWTDTFEKIVEHCKNHLVENREEIGQYDLTINDLKKFNPLYYKRDKGKIVEGFGPTLYAKLIASKKHNKILTMFYDTNGESVDPLSIMKKYCYAVGGIKIESIFVGGKITLQVKLYEAQVELLDAGMKPLMERPKPSGRLLMGTGTTMNDVTDEDAEESFQKLTVKDTEKEDSIHGSDDEKEKPVEEEKPKEPVKRVVKKTVKKTS